ncbi:hypothetical protein ACV1DR_15470, partial [Aeromonas jandaei]
MVSIEFDDDGFSKSSGSILCHCCASNGEYIGENYVFVSSGMGLPAHAYLDAPPKYSGKEIPVRMGRIEPWVIVPDLRGEIAYNRHSAPDLGINLPIALTQYLQNDLLV